MILKKFCCVRALDGRYPRFLSVVAIITIFSHIKQPPHPQIFAPLHLPTHPLKQHPLTPTTKKT